MPNPLGPIETAGKVLRFVARESDQALTAQVGDLMASPAGVNTAARAAEVIQLPITRINTWGAGASEVPGINAVKPTMDKGLPSGEPEILDSVLKMFANPSNLVLDFGPSGLFGSQRPALKIAWNNEAPTSMTTTAKPALNLVNKPETRSFEQIFETPRTPLQMHLNSVYGEIMAAVDDVIAKNSIRKGLAPTKALQEPLFQTKHPFFPPKKDAGIIDI